MRILAFILASLLAAAWPASAQPVQKPFAITRPVQDKVVPLLPLIERDAPARAALAADPGLSRITSAWRDRLVTAQATCASSAACYTSAAKLTGAETAAIEAELRLLAETNTAV